MTSLFSNNEISIHLKKSKEEWEKFQEEYLKTHNSIEVTCLTLDDINLSGYIFKNCIFSAVIINRVNLDYSSFINCSFTGCEFSYLSLVNMCMNDILLDDVKVLDIILRGSTVLELKIINGKIDEINIDDCNLLNMISVHTEITSVSIQSSSIKRINGKNNCVHKISLLDVQIEELISSHTKIQQINCGSLHMEKSLIERGVVNNGQFNNTYINNSKLIAEIIKNTIVEDFDFLDGLMKKIDVGEISLEKIGLLDTKLVDCEWPSQTYKVSLFGKYQKAKHLLRQPVEDVMGIPSKLRNEIKIAQLVDSTISLNKSWHSRLWLWFWGITTEFGRSLFRLTFICGMALSLLMVVFVFCYPVESIKNSFFETIFTSSKYVFYNFVGISILDTDMLNYYQNLILIIDRTFGILFMGLWAGVAANKIGSID